MSRKFKKRKFPALTLILPPQKEALFPWNGYIPLNNANLDRISFSVDRNKDGKILKIENISYDIFITARDEWVNVIRYDDHGGTGILHKHITVALESDQEIVVSDWITKTKSKKKQFNWATRDIKNSYLAYRQKFCKSSSIDLY
jgi:hypothetical protein